MYRHRRNVPDGFHIPDLAEQFFLRKYMIRILRKKCQEVKLLCRELLLLAVDPDTSRRLIDADSTDLDRIILRRIAADQPLIARQMCLHARHQLARRKWLGNIVIRSQSKTADFIDVILLRRHHQNRRVFLLPDLLADLKTVNARKHQIQDVHIKIFRQRPFQSDGSVILYLHLKSAEFQIILLKVCNLHLILNDQYSAHMAPPDIFVIQNTSRFRWTPCLSPRSYRRGLQ